MKKQFGEYYLGLDIGTDSVGWAVTDFEYKLQRINGKNLWGVRLFDSAQTAESRRMFRAARRRYKRRVKRLKLLQELLAEEISKLDPGFFHRLKESNLYPEDKESGQPYSLFADKSYTDIDYHKEYPTIYHLITDIIENPAKKFDIRLIYLALHHIVKYRGHFLFEGHDIQSVPSFEEVFDQFRLQVDSEIGWQINCSNQAVEGILKNKDFKVQARKRNLNQILDADTPQKKAIVSLLSGGTARLSHIFVNEIPEDSDIDSVTFAKADFEDRHSHIEDMLGDRIVLIDLLKAIYDWSLLEELLAKADPDKKYLSSAKVNIYEEHKKDLKALKKVVEDNYDKSIYDRIFRDSNVANNYCAYVGLNRVKKEKAVIGKRTTQEELCKFLRSLLKQPKEGDAEFDSYQNDSEYQEVIQKINDNTILPKQVNIRNGVIPFQLRHFELDKILDNAQQHYTFLLDEDEKGLTVRQKVKLLHTFRIPYYVGPINDAHRGIKKDNDICWVVKKPGAPQLLTPWNFEDIVDLEKTAEAFIRTRTNKCTYLLGEDVLPKESLLYSKYMVLNELNNLRINGEPISVGLKQRIFDDLFTRHKRVTGKRLSDYLLSEGHIERADLVSGFDKDFKSSLSSYIDFKGLFGDDVNDHDVQSLIENIILWIVLYGEDKKLLMKKLTQVDNSLLSDARKRTILGLKYSKWGRLSKQFLTGVSCNLAGFTEPQSIISAMWNTNNNLMELLSQRFGYIKEIERLNADESQFGGRLDYGVVDELPASPSVKRMLWQTLTIVSEVKKIMGRDPNKVFIEMTRSDEERPTRKESRKSALSKLYEACKDLHRDLLEELKGKPELGFRSDRLYLYFTQMGRCMYTGDKIDIDGLYSTAYDIDHIFPRSIIKDDGINNKVLVTATANREKADNYPLNPRVQAAQRGFWKMLKDRKLITDLKYERLTRTLPLTDKELGDFIARQIVETGQATKATADILKRFFSEAEIVYVKARNVSDFRQQFEIVKVREVNDFHHAHDAYLNIVVGNVYHTRFTADPWNFIKQRAGNRSYNMYKLFDYNVKRGSSCAWVVDNDKSITQVKKTIENNNVQFTRYSYCRKGGLFDQNILKKGKGQFPIVQTGKRSDISKYGGYGDVAGSYFILVEHDKNKKRIRTVEYIPVYLANRISDSKDGEAILNDYCLRILNLANHKVLISKIKMNSLIKANGFHMHLTGRSEARLLVRGAIQLLIDAESRAYLKKVLNINRRAQLDSQNSIAALEFYGISLEENLKIYDLLLDKHENSLYATRPNSQASVVRKGREKFSGLSLVEQCYLLEQMLLLFRCNNLTSDLRLIGGSKNAGYLRISKVITNYTQFKLMNQSPTGIFSQEVDLLAL